MKRILWLSLPLLVAACVVESHRSSGSPPPSSSPPTTPLVVVVDADKTMNATGGDGVGVFVEYKRGGTWHVFWTCDTSKSGVPCNFDVKLTAASGAIRNVQPDRLLASDQSAQNPDGSLEVKASTSANVAGVFFDADAGARVTLDATIAGVPKAGDYLFFVQDGKVNGGYNGTLTNPLVCEPSTP